MTARTTGPHAQPPRPYTYGRPTCGKSCRPDSKYLHSDACDMDYIDTLTAENAAMRDALRYVEARLLSVAVPSGQPEVSRAFADLRDIARAALARGK